MEKKVIAKVGDFSDEEMREVSIGEEAILIVRIDNEFYALGAKCTHYGAPMEQGILHDGRIRCPWHQACFDATSGDLEEPPALDALSKFEVSVEGEDVVLHLPEEIESQRVSKMSNYVPENDDRTFVILGAGSAGNAAAETLRQEGFVGRIVMVTKDEHLPYDRTMLTKAYLSERMKETPLLRSEEFYQENDIEILKGKTATGVDKSCKEIIFKEGSSQQYDKLLIATGGKPRTLKAPGIDLEKIYTLRNVKDADKINEKIEESTKAVIIGASFIGMETAASLTQRGLDVTIVGLETVPFEHTLGREIGKMYQNIHEEKGVTFNLESKVERFEGEEEVEKVILEDETEIETDFVIIGIGVVPATDFLKDFEKMPENSLAVDETLEFEQDVYAAGDIASFPDWRTGESSRIEHWRLAQQHGRVAAKNMADQYCKYSSVPYFWTRHFDESLQYVGHATDWDDIIYDGNPSERDFVAYFVKDGKVIATAGFKNASKMVAIAELMEENDMPSPEELKKGSVDLESRLNE